MLKQSLAVGSNSTASFNTIKNFHKIQEVAILYILIDLLPRSDDCTGQTICFFRLTEFNL